MKRPSAGRSCVALGLLMAFTTLARVARVDGLPYGPAFLAHLPTQGPILVAAALGFALALGAFLLGIVEDAAAGVLVALLAAGTQALAWQSPGDLGANGATMLPGGALLAWWLARRAPGAPETRAWRGIEAACGLIAAGYFVAAVSKVWVSGFAWAGPGNIGLQIATQGSLVGEPFQSLRMQVASWRPVCGFIGVATLFLEGGALVYLWPSARVRHAIALVVMHLGIGVLMGLHHYDWMFTALGWALWSAGVGGAARVPGLALRSASAVEPPLG